MCPMTTIPLLDLQVLHLNEKQGMRELDKAFGNVYRDVGFAYIYNHGIDNNLIGELFSTSKQFHALPLKTKMEVELNHLHRGYIPINTSTDVGSKLARVTKPNQSASFMMMREDEAGSYGDEEYLAGPNQWPDLFGLRETLTLYHESMAELAHALIGVAFRSINVDPHEMLQAFQRPTTWLRPLHYPSVEVNGDAELYGSAPHTDFGCLTILAQDEVGGLQVQATSGEWLDVPYKEGTFVINVGDMLHRWSNGLLRSTPHRVINRSGEERYSCPFFYDPNVATNISPLEACSSVSNPKRLATLNFGEFLKQQLQLGYDKHQQA